MTLGGMPISRMRTSVMIPSGTPAATVRIQVAIGK